MQTRPGRAPWQGPRRIAGVPTGLAALAIAGTLAAFLLLDAISGRVLAHVDFLGVAGAKQELEVFIVVLALLVTPAVVAPERLLRWHVGAVATLVLVWSTVVTLRSGVFDDAVMSVVTALTCYLLGQGCLRTLRTGADLPWQVAVVVGGGLLSVLMLALGHAGLLSAWSAGSVVVLLPVAVAVRAVRRHGARLPPAAIARSWARAASSVTETRAHAAVFAALCATVMAVVVWTSAPEIQFDALWAKAWLPGHWAHTGRISTQFAHPILNLTGVAELVAVPAHTFGADAAGRFLQLLAGLAVVSALWTHTSGRRRSWTGPVGGLMVAATPHMFWQMSTSYDDAVLALLAVGLALAVVSLPAAGEGAGRAGVVVGLVAGTCLAGKLHLAPLAGTVVLAWAISQEDMSRRWRAMAGAALGSTITGAAGFFYSLIATGNPIFPQYNAVFRSRYYPLVNETYNFPYSPDGSFRAWLTWPVDAVREPSRFLEAAPPGVFGALSVILPIALALGWLLGRRWLAVWVGLLLATAYWWTTFRYLRYLLPTAVVAVLVLSLLAAGSPTDPRNEAPAVDPRRLRVKHTVVGAGSVLIVLAGAPSTLAAFWNVPGYVPWRVALGAQNASAYVDATVAGSRVLRRFNQLGRPGDVMVGRLHARTLVTPDLDLTPGWELGTVLAVRGVREDDAQATRDAARALGVNWAAVSGSGLSGVEPVVATLVRGYGEIVFAADNYVLYRLSNRPRAPQAGSAVALCDPGFTGAAGCWSGTLDTTAGLSASEAPGGAVQSVPACAGTTYRATVHAGAGDGGVRIALTTPLPADPPWYTSTDVPPTNDGQAVFTMPAGGMSLTVQVLPLGAGVADHVSLERLAGGDAC